jgi:hypothetical protein
MPRNICEIAEPAYLVHLMRNHRLYQRKFPFSGGRDKAQALADAQAWLAQLLLTLPPRQTFTRKRPYLKACMRHKRTCDRVGIHRAIKHGRHRNADTWYVVFMINWIDDQGRTRNKTFYAGNVDTLTDADERHAYQTALAFREHWEHCQDTHTPFDPTKYKRWHQVTCYPFVATS